MIWVGRSLQRLLMQHLLLEELVRAICVANHTREEVQRRNRVATAASHTKAAAIATDVVADKLHQGQRLTLSCKAGIYSKTFDSCDTHR
jgi:hypothetical protein